MEKKLHELEELLRAEHAAHVRLGELLEAKRAVMRSARAGELNDCCRREHQQVQEIARLEKRRLEVAAELTLLLEPVAARPWTLAELAEKLGEPRQGRLLVLRAQLRGQVEAVAAQSGVMRRASEALLRHMQGLAASVGSALTQVGLYTRQGGRPREALAVSTFHTTG